MIIEGLNFALLIFIFTHPIYSLVMTTANVWSTFSDLSIKTASINLGQGYPDWRPPRFLLDSLSQASSHQYTRPSGHPPLVELLANRYRQHLERNIDAFDEVAVTVGASQALFLTLSTILKPGDEIIIFEPFFELYLKQIALTGANPIFVPLGGKAASTKDPWGLDLELLERSITKSTKVLLLNSPHNPTGKVFTRSEMEGIADIVRRNPQIVVISDEVYKFTVYNPITVGDKTSVGHHHFARLPGMWDRTVTISSCGKTFSVTGWQVGWIVAPSRFISPIQALLPCIQFCAATPIQEALAESIVLADKPYMGQNSYYEWLRCQFASKRAILEEGLQAIGISSLVSHGGFFLMARLPLKDRSEILKLIYEHPLNNVKDNRIDISDEPYDWLYCRYLALQVGVVGIPASPFFSRENYFENGDLAPMARFAFCKTDDTLNEARRRLIRKAGSV